MRIAALDFGSNTFLCLVAEVGVDSNGLPQINEVLSDEVRMVRLGQGVSQSRRFHPEALARARLALQDFRQTLNRLQPEVILAMATSAARDVENKEELFQLAAEFQIPLEIIPGHLEARVTYQGAMSGTSNPAEGSTLVVDVGGGSTEFILGGQGDQSQHIVWAQSLDLGCVRLKERLISGVRYSSQEIEKARALIRNELQVLPNNVQGLSRILAVAGTPTEIARLEIGHFDPTKIDGFRLSKKTLEKWVETLSVLTADQIHQLYQVSMGRADVLVIGLLILIEALNFFKQDELVVSSRGVRFGIALEACSRQEGR